MNERKIGRTSVVESTVTDAMLADAVGSGSLPVLATPAVCALVEKAAAALAQESLPEGITTVGTSLTLEHLRATAPGAPVRAYQLSAHATGRAAFAIATAIPLCPGRPCPVCFSVWPRPTSARRACSPLPLAILYYLPRKRVNEAARGWGRTSMAAKGPASGGVLAMGLLHGHTGCPPRPGFPPPCPLRPAASSRDVRPAKLGRTAWPPGQSLGNASETHIRPRPHFPRGTRAKHRKLHLLPSRAASTAKKWAARPRVPQLRRLSGPWVIRTWGADG